MEWNIGDIVKLEFSKDDFTVMQTGIFENEKYYLLYNLNDAKEMYIVKKLDKNTDELELVKNKEKINKILDVMAE